MAKKLDFSSSIAPVPRKSLIGKPEDLTNANKIGSLSPSDRPRAAYADQNRVSSPDNANNASGKGLNPNFTRTSFVISKNNLSKLKALAYWANTHYYEVLDEILNTYFLDKNIKPIPIKSVKEKLNDALK